MNQHFVSQQRKGLILSFAFIAFLEPKGERSCMAHLIGGETIEFHDEEKEQIQSQYALFIDMKSKESSKEDVTQTIFDRVESFVPKFIKQIEEQMQQGKALSSKGFFMFPFEVMKKQLEHLLSDKFKEKAAQLIAEISAFLEKSETIQAVEDSINLRTAKEEGVMLSMKFDEIVEGFEHFEEEPALPQIETPVTKKQRKPRVKKDSPDQPAPPAE